MKNDGMFLSDGIGKKRYFLNLMIKKNYPKMGTVITRTSR